MHVLLEEGAIHVRPYTLRVRISTSQQSQQNRHLSETWKEKRGSIEGAEPI